MRFSYSIIKEYLKGDLSKDKLIEYLEILGLNTSIVSREDDDLIFEIETPANRGDLLSIIGIAREIIPFDNLSLNIPPMSFEETVNEKIKIEIEDSNDCPYYSCRIIKNVKVESSPSFLKEKIEKLGFRSINNVVDISNLVMAEIGQPLHIFDLHKIKEKIVVRKGRIGEKLITIDGKERSLNPEILVISDKEKPIAIGGIMGGVNSEVCNNTKSILIESAKFNPKRIRRSSKNLGLTTESSLRFEKDIDIETVKEGMRRTTYLIAKICGGEIGKLNEEGDVKREKVEIPLSLNKVNSYLGVDIGEKFIKDLFSKLNFKIEKKKKVFHILPPCYRNDLKEEVDIIEEIAKYWKYSEIPVSIPKAEVIPTPSDVDFEKLEKAKDIMVNLGFLEVINLSLISEEIVNIIKLPSIPIINPFSRSFNYLRPSLIPGILENIKFNFFHQIEKIKIFEIGKIYYQNEKKYLEENHLSLSMFNTGNFFTLKGIIESFLEKSGINYTNSKFEDHLFGEEGKAIAFYLSDLKIASAFLLNEKLKKFFEIKEGEVYIGEIYIDKICKFLFPEKLFKQLPKFPSIQRDLSFLVPEEIIWNEIESLLISQKIPIEKIEVFDIYKGKNIPDGKISISFSLIFREKDRTLKNEEVDEWVKNIIDIIEKKFNAKLRK